MPKPILLFAFLQLLCHSVFSQDNQRINSGELIEQAIKLHDDAQYKEAIAIYRKISHNDTNYCRALYEMSLSCSADSNYSGALAACEEGLKQFSRDYELDLMVSYANVLDDMGDSVRALRIYDSALTKYPGAQGLMLNKATTLLRMDKVKEAKDICEALLLKNPFYASAHYRMAICALRESRPVPAMMSLFTYLMIAPQGRYMSSAIRYLSNISSGSDDIVNLVSERKEEEKEYYSSIEQIILSKVALDPKYKLVGGLDDPIVRQLQVMMEKLEYKPEENDFWMQFYAPLFRSIFEKDQFGNAVYFAFSGLDLESIKKYVKNNKSELKNFTNFTSSYLQKILTTRVLNYNQRINTEDIYHTDDDGVISSKGKLVKSEMIGPWEFYYSNGNLRAIGSFNDAGKKQGEWKYYTKYGEVSGAENWSNGIRDGMDITNNSWGVTTEKEQFRNGEREGEKINYFSIGHPSRISHYSNGKQTGSLVQFYSTGRKKIEASYTDDKLNGPYKMFQQNGQLETIANYSSGELNGDYKTYHDNGQISFEGNYVKGKATGEVKNYHANGKLQRVRTYNDGEQTGVEMEYNEEGILVSRIPYEKGKADGIAEYYDDDGKLYCNFTFKNNGLVATKFFNKEGKEISSSQLSNKSITVDSYTPDGVKASTSMYDDKGLQTGTNTFFYSNGKIKETNTYKQGQLEETSIGYYLNGTKSAEINYSEGVKDGIYKAYYANGQVSTTGWYDHDSQVDSWINYNEKGVVTTRSYYLNNDLSGYKESYYASGKLDDEEIYQNGWLIRVNQYDTSGNLLCSTKFDKGNGRYKEIFPNGKTKSEGDYVKGEWNGTFKNYHCDGSIYSVKYFDHGLADSAYKEYYPNGKISAQGQYKLGDIAGTWKYFDREGNITHEFTYKDGVQEGKTIYYFPNGKIENEISYKNGRRNGEYKRYSEDGQLGSIIYYKDDMPVGYSYPDKNNQLVPSIKLIAGNGKVLTYYANGNKSAEFEFAEGKINGKYSIYHSNGKVYYETTDEYGIVKGAATEYNSDGSLRSQYNYFWDNLEGPYKEYYNNGKVKEEGTYYDGLLNGDRKFFDVNGKLVETDYYYYGSKLSIKK